MLFCFVKVGGFEAGACQPGFDTIATTAKTLSIAFQYCRRLFTRLVGTQWQRVVAPLTTNCVYAQSQLPLKYDAAANTGAEYHAKKQCLRLSLTHLKPPKV